MKGKNKASKNPWPINFAMDLFEISKEEFQHPETINRRFSSTIAFIEKFKHLTVEGVLDLFEFDQNHPREKKLKRIIISYYKDGRTLGSIGDDYGVTGERVRELKMKGFNILRERLMKIDI